MAGIAFALHVETVAAHGSGHLGMPSPRLTAPEEEALPPSRSTLDKPQSTNPYKDMSCVQLYVLSTQKQDKALDEEFEKKDCPAL